MARLMQITTPLGDDLLFQSLRGNENLGSLFEFNITVLSSKHDVDPTKLLGKHVTAKMEMRNGKHRFFDGFATRVAQLGMVDRYFQYEIIARPWLWLLTRTSDCRIFQGETVPQILDKIFAKYPEASVDKSKLDTKNYRKWNYCVQYRETDFNFISRLMEQEGMYFFFRHEEGKHTLVLCDGPDDHAAFDGYDSMQHVKSSSMARPDQEYVEEWRFQKEIQPGKYMMRDFDFTKPSDTLQVKTEKARTYPHADHEYFDYPGEYVTSGEGDYYAKVRMEELQTQQHQAQGSSNSGGLVVGHTFSLTDHPRDDQNQEYLIIGASYHMTYGGYTSGRSGQGTGYECSFAVVPKAEPFRPARVTPKPIVQGPQTAIVVGPKGDEIYTDPDGYGMVKVHFHWDRHGEKDEKASCWIRVAHAWAGQNWGMIAIPRIGQEVIVDFLEGDPDEPIINGRVYNAEQMPPYALPANNTQTGIKSRSSAKGTPDNFNEIRFEDKKGSEQLFIHAEKNQDIEVENDETHWVGHDRKKTIDHDETTLVKHDRTETVGNNETISIGVDRKESVGSNETISIGVNRTETVGSNETITVGSNRSVTVNASETKTVALQRTHTVGVNETITVGGAQEITIGGLQAVTIGALQTVTIGAKQTIDVGATRDVSVGAAQSVKVGANGSMKIGADEARDVTGGRNTSIGKDDNLKVAKNLVIDAGDSVTIKTGEASISMKKDGTISITGKKITIKGTDITVDGSGKVNATAGGDMTLKGSKILQN